MLKQRNAAQAIRFVVTAAILGAAAFTSGSAHAQSVLCSASGSGGRLLATITVSDRDPSVCIRQFLNVPAPLGTPSCWEAVRNAGLPCVDATGRANIVDLR